MFDALRGANIYDRLMAAKEIEKATVTFNGKYSTVIVWFDDSIVNIHFCETADVNDFIDDLNFLGVKVTF